MPTTTSEVEAPTDPAVLRTLATMALLNLVLPVNAAVTGLALLGRALRPPAPPAVAAERRTVLLDGGKMTKSLCLARAFHAAGHRVVLAETAKYRLTGHRFSRAVDVFRTIPDLDDPGYTQALVDLVVAEGVDVFVPVCSPAASWPDAVAKEALSAHCEVLHLDPDMVARLDDKHAFGEAAVSLGLTMPDSHRITDPQQVLDFDFGDGSRPYVMKSIAYDPVRRLDLTPLPRPTLAETEAFVRALPISADNPWILQEFLTGEEFCCHTTVRDGHVQVYADSASSAFQINYAMVHDPEVQAWARRFVEGLGLTGQVSFDLIRAADGRLCGIECNPRTHSAITMFYDHPDLAAAYLEDGHELVVPTSTSKPTYWTYHEVWRLLRGQRSVREQWRVLTRGTDAVFDRDDPLPFLLVHHLQIPSLLLRNLRERRGWTKIDFNIGKLVEPAGD